MTNRKKQIGSVSLFVVVFTALLITIITVSFVRIMLQNQQQASSNDLSQSAYDSAQAGVEDAKRALLQYQTICNNDASQCAEAAKKIDSSIFYIDSATGLACNEALTNMLDDVRSIAAVDSTEIKVQTKASDDNQSGLDQAYTCVKIYLNTNNYLGKLSNNESNIIPLVGEEAFDTVQIEWFSSKDVSPSDLVLNSGVNTPLLYTWGDKQPPIMRTQLIQFASSGFSLGDFNNSISSTGSNTLFLYPSSLSGYRDRQIITDIRRQQTGSPRIVTCNRSFSTYACTARVTLPSVVSGEDHSLFLRLTSIYNTTEYRVTLLNGSSLVQFSAVQPQIDSTGRANDLFRRVMTRVELTDDSFPYPQAEVDLSGNFCKNFSVTNVASDFNMDDFDNLVGVGGCQQVSYTPPPTVTPTPTPSPTARPGRTPTPTPYPDQTRYYP